jgi:hypothetical protein
MARMSREFSLVLAGAGLLAAGFFFIPESAASKSARALRRPARPNERQPVKRAAVSPAVTPPEAAVTPPQPRRETRVC